MNLKQAKSSLKKLARHSLAMDLPYRIIRNRALGANPVSILCYHTLGPDAEEFDAWTVLRVKDFREQLGFLRKHYDIVSLDDALADSRPGKRPLAVLTFDDGDIGLYTHLLPLVEREKVPVTIYVATSQIEDGRPYWFDRIMNGLQSAGPFSVDLRAQGLKQWDAGDEHGAQRWAVISDILETLKTVPPDRRQELSEDILRQVGGGAHREFTPLAPMSVAQIAELSASEWVTIGSHSHCHSLLDQLSPAQISESAERSRALLEGWTGRPVRHFAYPNGNHDETVRGVISGLGFLSATTLGMRLCDKTSDPFALPRIAIGRYDDLSRFKLRLVEV